MHSGYGPSGPLTLDAVLLHLLDLGHGLPEVVGELLAVLGVGGVEVDQHLDVRSRDRRCQPHPVRVIWGTMTTGVCF